MRTTMLGAAIALLLTGCTSAVSGEPARPDPPVLSAPAGQIVFQVDGGGGGKVLPDWFAGRRPAVTIYGNGDAYVLPVADENRGYPARPLAFVRSRVPADVLARLVVLAASSGLFERADFGTPNVTDLSGTTVTFRPGRAAARDASAYALSYSGGDDDVTPRQRANRVALRGLIDRLTDAATPGRRPADWIPSRVDVLAAYGDTSGATTVRWPGPPLATLLRDHSTSSACGTLSGAPARRVYTLAREAGSLRWRDGADVRNLVVRALLPGEEGCSTP